MAILNIRGLKNLNPQNNELCNTCLKRLKTVLLTEMLILALTVRV